jgi:hypothetical protein
MIRPLNLWSLAPVTFTWVPMRSIPVVAENPVANATLPAADLDDATGARDRSYRGTGREESRQATISEVDVHIDTVAAPARGPARTEIGV